MARQRLPVAAPGAAVPGLPAQADLTLAEGLQLATVNPGRLVGHRGRFAKGELADLIVFDWRTDATSLTIRETYVAGERCSAE